MMLAETAQHGVAENHPLSPVLNQIDYVDLVVVAYYAVNDGQDC